MTCIAIVAIGRNESGHLSACLESAIRFDWPVVYVDSGSSDNSVAIARHLDCAVLELDSDTPFTAARARNEGFGYIQSRWPDTTYVQFVDGDCQLAPEWLPNAIGFLDNHPDVAAVCGRLRELYPCRSIYNTLCDIEWDRPAGETSSCGGIAMMRTDAFLAAGGFRADIIAGEEPELCVRLRTAGWRIWRLSSEMALHDAAINHFSEWWRRSKRAGYAFAQGATLHGKPPERHYVLEARRSLIWGILLPTIIFSSSALYPWLLALLLAYPMQIIRIATRCNLKGRKAFWYSLFMVLGRFPEGLGLLQFYIDQILRRSVHIVKYKQ